LFLAVTTSTALAGTMELMCDLKVGDTKKGSAKMSQAEKGKKVTLDWIHVETAPATGDKRLAAVYTEATCDGSTAVDKTKLLDTKDAVAGGTTGLGASQNVTDGGTLYEKGGLFSDDDKKFKDKILVLFKIADPSAWMGTQANVAGADVIGCCKMGDATEVKKSGSSNVVASSAALAIALLIPIAAKLL